MFGGVLKKTHMQSHIIFVEAGFSTANSLLESAKNCTHNGKDAVVLQVMPVYFDGSSYSRKTGYIVEFVYKEDFDAPTFKELYMYKNDNILV